MDKRFIRFQPVRADWPRIKIAKVTTIRQHHEFKSNRQPSRRSRKKFWLVRWHEAGNLKRKLFTGRQSSEAHAISLRGSALGADQQFLMLPQSDREKLMLIWKNARERGIDPLVLLSEKESPTRSPAIADVMAEMEAVKRNVGRAGDYLKSLVQIVTMFAKGRERLAINKFTVRAVEVFLDSKKCGLH